MTKKKCPFCGNDDKTMLEVISQNGQILCNVCAKVFVSADKPLVVKLPVIQVQRTAQL